MEQARAALLQGLDRLRPGDRFNIVAYSGTYQALADRSLPATDEGLARYVVLLTDGDLGNEDQIFTALEQGLGAARLFTVAIGSAPNHHLATRMAEYGRGSFTHIADVGEVEAQMGRL